ncbi:hypothetical protein ACIBF1_42515 [Spirillospora sp. NPDC050679]
MSAADGLDGLLEILASFPADARDFSVGPVVARRAFGLDEDALAALVAAGLYSGTADAPLFDHHDLMNVALESRNGSAMAYGPAAWARLLNGDHGPSLRARIDVVPECSGEHADSACRFRVRCPGGGWAEPGEGETPSVVLDLPAVWPQPDPRAAELLAEFDRFRFVRLPPALGADLDLAARTGVADCNAVPRLLVREGLRRGVPVRLAHGLILSAPFAILHFWAEIRTEGVWVPHDPLIRGALVRWGLLDAAAWPVTRSTGKVLARIAGAAGPVAFDHGGPTGASYPTMPRAATTHEEHR